MQAFTDLVGTTVVPTRSFASEVLAGLAPTVLDLREADDEILERCRALYSRRAMIAVEWEFAEAQRLGGAVLDTILGDIAGGKHYLLVL